MHPGVMLALSSVFSRVVERAQIGIITYLIILFSTIENPEALFLTEH